MISRMNGEQKLPFKVKDLPYKRLFLFMLLSQFVKRQFGSQSNAIGCIDFYGIYWKDLASLLAPG